MPGNAGKRASFVGLHREMKPKCGIFLPAVTDALRQMGDWLTKSIMRLVLECARCKVSQPFQMPEDKKQQEPNKHRTD